MTGLITLLLVWTLQAPDRCSIDTGPWEWPVHPPKVQQAYGQAQATYSSTGIHLGVDLAGPIEAPVFAPFSGVVEEVTKHDWEVEIVLRPVVESGWRARLLHVVHETVYPGQSVVRGTKLGQVARWKGHSHRSHVHLEVYDEDNKNTRTLANPLAFLKPRPDAIPPEFHELVDSDGYVVQTGVMLAKHTDWLVEPLKALTSPLEPGEVDILVSVTDEVGPCGLAGTLEPLAPARVSVAIWKWNELVTGNQIRGRWGPFEVYARTIDLRGEIRADSGSIYRPSPNPSIPPSLADQYLVLTNSLEESPALGWQTAGSGQYLLTVTAEDLAGNATLESLWFRVR